MKEIGSEELRRALHEVAERARERAERSEFPNHFMNTYEHKMRVLMADSEYAVLDRMPFWGDATHMAAEIEALSAYRAVAWWGSSKGLCLPAVNRNHYGHAIPV